MIKLSELQMKEIIIVSNGRRLGHIDDLEIDVDLGKINSLIIFVKENDSIFGKQEEVSIPWHQIVTIVTDIIIVIKGKTFRHIDYLYIDVDKRKINYSINFVKENDSIFVKQEEVSIPWNQIVTIGTDVILVQDIDYPQSYPSEK